jgi:AcrR family transcriptional regulator
MRQPAVSVAETEPKSARAGRSKGRPASGAQSVGREALITATCELLKTYPPNEVTRALVARHTQVDPSLIRYYFRDRSSLLVAAADSIGQRYRVMVEDAIAKTDKSARARLVARVGALIELDATYPFFNRLILEEVMPSPAPGARKMIKDMQSNALNRYTELVLTGLSEGTIRDVDPAYLFVSVVGLCEFLNASQSILEIATGTKLDRDKHVKTYRDFICNLIVDGVGASGGDTIDAPAKPKAPRKTKTAPKSAG